MSLPSVLLVHNRYVERGGEEAVFEAESALLEAHGHRVERIVFDNQDLPAKPSAKEKLRLAVGTVWSNSARRRLRDAVAAFKPDIVHFHNTLPRVSPAAYEVAKQGGARVVQTLHNFRLVCPSGLMYRDGRPCDDCLGKTLSLPAIHHGCYRDSRSQSAAVATMLAFHRLRGTYERDIDLYIAPSRFLRDKVIEGGIRAELIAVKPNFVSPDPGPGRGDGGYALYAGRLTRAKGIETLLEAYRRRPDLPPLHICGEGELAPAAIMAAAMDRRILYRGRLNKDGVMAEMESAACLIFPSRWYENFPVTIVEAFARGLPVVGSRLGAVPGIVEDGHAGRLFRPGDPDDLAEKLIETLLNESARHEMAANARYEYLSKYTGERNYEMLLGLYDGVLGRIPVAEAATAAPIP